MDGLYQPIPIEQLDGQTHQGYSPVLNLNLRWEDGNLGWYDPATGRHIPTFSEEREARIRAEARVRELEEQLRRRGDPIQ